MLGLVMQVEIWRAESRDSCAAPELLAQRKIWRADLNKQADSEIPAQRKFSLRSASLSQLRVQVCFSNRLAQKKEPRPL